MVAECEQLDTSQDIGQRRSPDRAAVTHLHAVDGARAVEKVPIAELVGADSPRSGGADEAHVLRLIEAGDQLPPIIVHRPTMRVIDGVHRVRAAVHEGRTEIDAIFFEGSRESAFVLAVQTNIRHGLPLSLSDRRAAAVRIIGAHPAWSDRMIAKIAGLSARTVRGVRTCATAESEQLHGRVGADGRYRPLASATSRQLAAEMLTAHPEASLRQVAKAVGISPGTVRDVRDRLRRGEDPVLPRRTAGRPAPRREAVPPTEEPPPVDVPQMLQTLGKDPSLRLNEEGRKLLRWLHLHAVDLEDCAQVIASAPDHCVGVMAELARGCADSWARISAELADRVPD
ncbi:ParB/RepB/Spo0J family partition protein [Nocardia terpenica]|uniref:Streptomycin biosynthesis protein n=1 Tax=Nocardia terpenica TaxID=455432 RepID=A0A291RGI1_9NOCA|nr:ParB/RepB/Spo0J family partition protein [Nocardia terpenica]ATL66408.1 streptomycin biosynthesis protein [Nocardia terpenica]